jgi:hypothetical protein
VKRIKRTDLSWRERLPFAIVGVFVMIYGYGESLRGRWVYATLYGQDITAKLVMILGALFVLAAIFPWGHLTFLWQAGRRSGQVRGGRSR